MSTRVVSFGFKYGLPVDADLVFDVRLLDNPFFVPDLRNLSGADPLVRAFVMKSPEAQELVEKTAALLAFALPRYEREGKSYLTVAVGCTGGRHRSVTIATVLAERLRNASEASGTSGASETSGASTLPILVFHRDVARADMFGSYPPPRGGHEGAAT
jgi:UPF0042 nucleotide-binding protein